MYIIVPSILFLLPFYFRSVSTSEMSQLHQYPIPRQLPDVFITTNGMVSHWAFLLLGFWVGLIIQCNMGKSCMCCWHSLAINSGSCFNLDNSNVKAYLCNECSRMFAFLSRQDSSVLKLAKKHSIILILEYSPTHLKSGSQLSIIGSIGFRMASSSSHSLSTLSTLVQLEVNLWEW